MREERGELVLLFVGPIAADGILAVGGVPAPQNPELPNNGLQPKPHVRFDEGVLETEVTACSSETLVRKGRNGQGSHGLPHPPRQRPTQIRHGRIVVQRHRLIRARNVPSSTISVVETTLPGMLHQQRHDADERTKGHAVNQRPLSS